MLKGPNKVIPTTYKGITFRSRTEARWAVAFEKLGVTYIWEPEGYDLDGRWYLPDFWMPGWKMFVEIKADLPSETEIELCQRLSAVSGHPVLLLAGHPGVIDQYRFSDDALSWPYRGYYFINGIRRNILGEPDKTWIDETTGIEEVWEEAWECEVYHIFGSMRKDGGLLLGHLSDSFDASTILEPGPELGQEFGYEFYTADSKFIVQAMKAAANERFSN